MTKFKVGQEVRIKSKSLCSPLRESIGKVLPIERIKGDGSGINEDNCIVIDGNYYAHSDLELVEDYKVGDVVLVAPGSYYNFGRSIGKIENIVGNKIHIEVISREGGGNAGDYDSWPFEKSLIIKKFQEGEIIEHFQYKNPKYFEEPIRISATPWETNPFYNLYKQEYNISKPSLREKTMKKLSELSQKIRRAFSPEQKSLWQAGYIDDCGNWTPKASTAVVDVLCDEKKKELVELANEEIALAKEEKKED
jgi:hypothetical protein